MKKLLRIFLLVSITALMASCKLAVIVVEGGEVRSTGSGTCVAGTICIVDVTDPYFSETFTAIPDDDWYFEKWNSGGGFFCGDSTNPKCTLSFQGYEETKEVEDVVASSATFYLMPIFKPGPDTVTVDGIEWYQPERFNNLSWNDINIVCPKGVCAGRLNGYDMTGWTWASVEDLNALFNYYAGLEATPPGSESFYRFADLDATAASFLKDGWSVHDSGLGLSGRLSSESGPEDGHTAILLEHDFSGLGLEALPDRRLELRIWLEPKSSKFYSIANGAWFYRIPSNM